MPVAPAKNLFKLDYLLGSMSPIPHQRMDMLLGYLIISPDLAIFTTPDPGEALNQLSARDIEKICRFYHGRSSRKGVLNDLTHTMGADTLTAICPPTLVIHSWEDKSVPFAHAELNYPRWPQEYS